MDSKLKNLYYGMAAVGVIAVFGLALAYLQSWNFNQAKKEIDRENTKNEINKEHNADKDRNNLKNKLPKTDERLLKFLFFGDLMLDRHVGEKIKQNGLDYLFANLATTTSAVKLGDYDLVSANLEGAVTDDGEHYPPNNSYDFAFAPVLVGELKKYNFNFFSIANNHLADQGERGIIETRKNLDGLGFAFAGCEDKAVGECSIKNLAMPAGRQEVRSKEIGMAGFSLVYGLPDEQAMIEEVKKLASSTDLVIVNMHWGVEYEHKFNPVQQRVAHELIDAGADLIIGHHPHVVQGVEVYKGKAIFYSLGNFIFDQYFSTDTQEGLAIGLDVSGDNINFNLFPLKSKASQVRVMAGEEKTEFLKKFSGWSKINNIKISEDGSILVQ